MSSLTTPARISVARRQAMQKAIDSIVHHFKVNSRSKDNPTGYPARAADMVRVFLQRSIGFTFDRIEQVYRIPRRTAKRWEKLNRGKAFVGHAVNSGEISYSAVAERVGGFA